MCFYWVTISNINRLVSITRIRDMDKISLDMQVLFPAPTNVAYHLEPEDGLRYSQKYNNAIAEVVKAYPHRFLGMATVPMQDIEKAIVELERAVCELDLKAVEILSDINSYRRKIREKS